MLSCMVVQLLISKVLDGVLLFYTSRIKRFWMRKFKIPTYDMAKKNYSKFSWFNLIEAPIFIKHLNVFINI